MNDLSFTIKPKSDQLNADDLIAGPITETVQAVNVYRLPAVQAVQVNATLNDCRMGKT